MPMFGFGPTELLIAVLLAIVVAAFWMNISVPRLLGRICGTVRRALSFRQQTSRENPTNYDKARRAWGICGIAVGICGFVASAVYGGGGSFEGAIVAGLLNPLFFVGIPLGLWFLRSAYAYPNLVRCSDCRNRVSAAAKFCPRCGKAN